MSVTSISLILICAGLTYLLVTILPALFYIRLFLVCNLLDFAFVNRRLLNPNATLISKKQSYYLVFLTNLLLLGFAGHNSTVSDFNPSGGYGFLFGIVPLYFLVLIGGLSPTRQTL